MLERTLRSQPDGIPGNRSRAEDAAHVTSEGLVYGREAIEKSYRRLFRGWHPTDYSQSIDQVYMLSRRDRLIVARQEVPG